MLEDKLLVHRFNRGDTDALRHIYEKYKNDLFKVAAALLNDKDCIEDVVHDVFVLFAGAGGNFNQKRREWVAKISKFSLKYQYTGSLSRSL